MLDLEAGALRRYEVTVRPDTLQVDADTDAVAGMMIGATAEGYYVAGVRVTGEDDGGAIRLQRRLQVLYVPSLDPDRLALVAASPVTDYSGEALTLSVVRVGDALTLSLGAFETLAAELAHGGDGDAGLAVLTTDTTGASLARFDDFTYYTLTSGFAVASYHYGDMNELVSISGAEKASFSYNDLGQCVSQEREGVAAAFGYDRLNRRFQESRAGSKSVYTYAGAGWARTRAVTPAGATSYVYDGFACVSQTTGDVTTEYAVPGREPFWETTGNSTLTYTKDGRGNVLGLYGAGGYAVRYGYDAYGNRSVLAGALPAQHASSVGYRGQMHDTGTGEIYLRNRYYEPSLGRFTSPDPMGYAAKEMNLYNYAGSDPVNRWDPMGLDWIFTGMRGDNGGLVDFDWEWDGNNGPAPAGGPTEIRKNIGRQILQRLIAQRPDDTEFWTDPIEAWSTVKARTLAAIAESRAARHQKREEKRAYNNAHRWGGSITYNGETHTYSGMTEQEWTRVSLDWYLRFAREEAQRVYEEREGVAPSGRTFEKNFDQLLSDPRVRKYALRNIAPLVGLPSNTEELKIDIAISGVTFGLGLVLRQIGKIARKVDVEHIFHGAINRRGRAVGFHHAGSIGHQGKARIKRVVRPPNAHGIYEAEIEIFDSAQNAWVTKRRASTMFPNAWNRKQVLDEVRGAFGNPLKFDPQSRYWEGLSPSGVTIGGYLDAAGDIATAFPIM